MATNPLSEAAASVVGTDRELQQRVRDLVDKMLSEAERQLLAGTPAAKLTMLRTVLPAVVKEARAHEQDGRIIELQAQLDALRIAVRQEIGANAASQHPTLPVDTPPSPITPHLSIVGERVVKR